VLPGTIRGRRDTAGWQNLTLRIRRDVGLSVNDPLSIEGHMQQPVCVEWGLRVTVPRGGNA
jgi:hypothetical protein